MCVVIDMIIICDDDMYIYDIYIYKYEYIYEDITQYECDTI